MSERWWREAWPARRLATLFAAQARPMRPELEVLSVYRDYGVVPKASRSDNFNRTPAGAGSYQAVRAGDLVVNRMKAWQGSLGVSPFEGLVSPDYEVLAPTTNDLDPRFAHVLLRSTPMIDEYGMRSTGIRPSQWRLYWEQMRTITIPVPPLEEQRAIAGYLDRETARIDTLIEEQQRLIEMLRERRWAVVERGVALLDWDTPLKAVATLIQTGPFGSQLKSDEYEDGGIPVINPSHIIAGEVVPDPRIAVSAEKAAQLARHTLEEGDLVAARRGDLGRCAVVRPFAAGFLCGTGSALVRLNQTRVEPSFAAMVFSSRRNRDALSLASVGSTMDNLNSDIIGALRVPVPPPDEQCRLTTELEGATAKIDMLIAETERFIAFARERRAALITAAVTGQIDVREMA
jgi:type I restriction enzyme S subunit